MTERETIDKLRRLAPSRTTPISLEQVTTLVAYISDGNITLDAMTVSLGLTQDEVVKLTMDLGTWLGQSINAGAGAIVYEHGNAPVVGSTSTNDGQLGLFKAHTSEYVVLPPGMENDAVGRDLAKAVSQIVRGAPSESTLRRWLMRRYHSIRQVLGFEIVAAVHRLSQIGRLCDIDELVDRKEPNTELARLIVEAYDLLDIARQDAVNAVNWLAQAGDKPLNAVVSGNVERAMVRCSWLAEADMKRIATHVDAAVACGDMERMRPGLQKLGRIIERNPAMQPNTIAKLSDGQVRRLCRREGLDLDGVQHTEVEKVRSWVTAHDLTSDSDLLIADGVRAVRAGLGDLFKDCLARRAEGDLEWAAELNDALAKVKTI